MRKAKILAVAAVMMSVAAFAGGEGSGTMYFSTGLLPVKYLEFPGPDSDVRIMRLNLLAGCHRSMYGLDIGSVGNWTTGGAGGIALAACYNVCQSEFAGLQLSCVNFTEERHRAGQIGLVNLTWGLRGFQIGLVNATSDGSGLQLGLYNMAEDFSGFQLGLVNMNHASPLLMMPILNVWF